MPVAGGGLDTRGPPPARADAVSGGCRHGRPAGMLVRRRDDHDPSPLRKAPLTATVGAAMLLISLYVRRILTASREPASQAASGAR